MRANASAGTRPELAARAACLALGLPEPALNYAGAPGTPDLAWPSARVALFVHGCFWHGHSCREWRHKTEYWRQKVEATRRRDAAALAALRRAGWEVVVVWECQVAGGLERAVRQVRWLVEERTE